MNSRQLLLVGILSFVLVVAAPAFAAAQNGAGTASSTAAIDSLNAFVPEASEIADKILQKRADVLEALPELDGEDVKELAKTNVVCQEALRLCTDLFQLGEPVAIDYYHTLLQADEKIKYLISTKRTGAIRQAAKREFDKNEKKRSRFLDKVTEYLEDGKVFAARKEMEKILVVDDAYRDFLERSLKQRWNEIVQPTWRELVKLESAKRVQQTRVVLDARMAANDPAADELVTTAVAACREIEAEGVTGQFGDSRDGPRAAEAIIDRWATAHDKMLRYTGLEWIHRGLEIEMSTLEKGWPVQSSQLAAASKLKKQLPPILANLITADLQRTPAEDVPLRFAEYMQVYRRLLALTAEPEFKPIEAALETFMQTEMGQPIGNYRAATEELARWKKRIVLSTQENRIGQAASLASYLDIPTRAFPYFNCALEEEMAKIESSSLDRSVTVRGLQSIFDSYLGFETADGFYRYAFNRHPSLESDPGKLLNALYCTDGLARSLRTADLIAGHVSQVDAAAGKILAIRILPLASFLAGIEDGQGVRCYPLGQLPATGAINSTFVDVVIEPRWFADDTFQLDVADAK